MHVVLARYCYRKSSVRPSVRPSVRLSVCDDVTLMYRGHVGWTSSKLQFCDQSYNRNKSHWRAYNIHWRIQDFSYIGGIWRAREREPIIGVWGSAFRSAKTNFDSIRFTPENLFESIRPIRFCRPTFSHTDSCATAKALR